MANVTQRRADIPKIAAIHHPVRRRLLEMLGASGPATASQLADRTGQLVGNVSYHLKALAKADLIEEATELARDRRERWWRQVPLSLRWSVANPPGTSDEQFAAAAAEQQNLSEHVDHVYEWFETRANYDPGWARAAYATESWLHLTAEELVELTERLGDLVAEFGRSVDAHDGQRRESVYFFAHAVPATPSPSTSTSTSRRPSTGTAAHRDGGGTPVSSS